MDAAADVKEDVLFEEQEDLRRLQTALRRAHRFALMFAVCNAPSYRNRLTQALQDSLARPIVRVHLKPIEDNPTMDVQIADALVDTPPDAAVFVFGLENLLPVNDAEKQFNTLRQLNWRRAPFGRLARPLVFWLPDYALTLIANESPDFYDWRSGVYIFNVPNSASPDAMQKTLTATANMNSVQGYSLEEKQRWREVLEELIAEPRGDTDVEQANLASLLNNLGILATQMADYENAEEQLTRALKINKSIFGETNLQTAKTISNLGTVYMYMNELEKARDAYLQTLEIHHVMYGPVHPDVAKDLGNVGIILHEMGNLEGAKEVLEHALQVNEAVYGADAPEVTRDYNNLGAVLSSLGDWQSAKTVLEKALNINKTRYGTVHLTVANGLNNLGKVLQDMGDLNGAKENYEQALSIFQCLLGEEHPTTQTAKQNLARVLAAIEEAQK